MRWLVGDKTFTALSVFFKNDFRWKAYSRHGETMACELFYIQCTSYVSWVPFLITAYEKDELDKNLSSIIIRLVLLTYYFKACVQCLWFVKRISNCIKFLQKIWYSKNNNQWIFWKHLVYIHTSGLLSSLLKCVHMNNIIPYMYCLIALNYSRTFIWQ